MWLICPLNDFSMNWKLSLCRQRCGNIHCTAILCENFRKFIIAFTQDLNENTEVQARNGTKWPALEVFARCLEYLKKTATDAVNGRHFKSSKDNQIPLYKDAQIQWVITVPAIWSISAKQFMRTAAYKVIIIHHIYLTVLNCSAWGTSEIPFLINSLLTLNDVSVVIIRNESCIVRWWYSTQVLLTWSLG